MNYIITSLISLGLVVVGILGVSNMSIGTLQKLSFNNNVGALTLTDITSNTKVSDYPTVQNANNTLVENVINSITGTTSISTLTSALNLASIGTITTGTWNATAIGVGYGGTGTTSPTLNQIMIGNGASGLKVVGFGNAGQFLMSNGNGLAPQWNDSSVDQTASFNFTGTTFRVRNLHASSTVANPIVLNTVSYNTPSAQGAASTTLTNDGSGNLVWRRPDWTVLASTTLTSAISTTTLNIPTTNVTDLHIIIDVPSTSGNTFLKMQFNGDTGNNYSYSVTEPQFASGDSASSVSIIAVTPFSAVVSGGFYADISVTNRPDLAKRVIVRAWNGAGSSPGIIGSAVWNNTSTRITSVSFGGSSSATLSAGTRITVYGSRE